ncbi:RidA family protein [Paracandidimonas soli]|uniref:Enamine deaminase RidA (YjgF/YER057c/UK114 family) n=1 Tax=Paracandidimonas soli TaxID=1917182 RepID=A0A4R3VD92_9BURK|nr:RidA family protein [Paracandidimonas soli]TCV00665.1 enamine deaminase RidA (YjgF/YER057c/UK114 family) [Paracandidimonas soli]
MSELKRINVGKRLSDVVVHNGVAYFAGQVPNDTTLDVEGQTKDVLNTIDELLAELGSDKTRILSVQIFMPNIAEFAGMNRAWDAWVPEGRTPARATIEARLANPDYKVEIMLTAAVD